MDRLRPAAGTLPRSATVGRAAEALATLGLLLNAAVWGLSFVLIRDALRGTSVAAFLTARFAIATAVLGAPLLLRGGRRAAARAAPAGLRAGLALAAGYLLQTVGLTLISAARAGFITGLSVVFVPPLARLLRGQLLRPRQIAALLPATLGLALIAGDAAHATALNAGDLLVLGCAVAFALQIALLAPRQGALPESAGPLALAFWQTAAVALAGALALPAGGARLTARGAAAAAFLGLAGTAGALWVQTTAQRHVSAARVAFLYTAEPLFAALFAVTLGGEALGGATLAGGALIVLGMLLGL